MLGSYIIFGLFALLSWAISARLQSKFKKYSKIAIPNGMTGRDVAEKMLRDNGIYDVKVISTAGQLTDHYNPLTKTVNLSEGVYDSCSVAAAAVAAHECGHAARRGGGTQLRRSGYRSLPYGAHVLREREDQGDARDDSCRLRRGS